MWCNFSFGIVGLIPVKKINIKWLGAYPKHVYYIVLIKVCLLSFQRMANTGKGLSQMEKFLKSQEQDPDVAFWKQNLTDILAVMMAQNIPRQELITANRRMCDMVEQIKADIAAREASSSSTTTTTTTITVAAPTTHVPPTSTSSTFTPLQPAHTQTGFRMPSPFPIDWSQHGFLGPLGFGGVPTGSGHVTPASVGSSASSMASLNTPPTVVTTQD